MRSWQAESKADIMVSELLGSFGDNELSPECLDGAQRYLKGQNNPSSISSMNCFLEDGISIPYSYTSYLCPIQSPKIFSELLYNRDANKPHYVRKCFDEQCGEMFPFRPILKHHLWFIYTIVFFWQKRNHCLPLCIPIPIVKHHSFPSAKLP